MSEEELVFALATLLVAVILATFQITWEIAKAVFQKDDPRTDIFLAVKRRNDRHSYQPDRSFLLTYQ